MSLPVAYQESDFTFEKLVRNPNHCMYFSAETMKWERLSNWEMFKEFVLWIICLGSFPDEVCQKRTWSAIEKMPALPKNVADRIEHIFLDSRMPSNPLNYAAETISRIYQKTLENETTEITQPTSKRCFTVIEDESVEGYVTSSEYGRLDFFNSECELSRINYYDTTYNTDFTRRLSSLKLDIDYWRTTSTIDVFDENDKLVLKADDIYSRTSLLFREATDNRIVALANYKNQQGRVHWSISFLSKRFNHQVLFATMKYSQHYHFREPIYFTGTPKHENAL